MNTSSNSSTPSFGSQDSGGLESKKSSSNIISGPPELGLPAHLEKKKEERKEKELRERALKNHASPNAWKDWIDFCSQRVKEADSKTEKRRLIENIRNICLAAIKSIPEDQNKADNISYFIIWCRYVHTAERKEQAFEDFLHRRVGDKLQLDTYFKNIITVAFGIGADNRAIQLAHEALQKGAKREGLETIFEKHRKPIPSFFSEFASKEAYSTPRALNRAYSTPSHSHIGSSLLTPYTTKSQMHGIDAKREDALPTPQNALPTSQSALPTPQGARPTSQNAFPTSQSALPTPQSARPTSQNALPTSQNALPTPQNAFPTPQNAFPTPQQSQSHLLQKQQLQQHLSQQHQLLQLPQIKPASQTPISANHQQNQDPQTRPTPQAKSTKMRIPEANAQVLQVALKWSSAKQMATNVPLPLYVNNRPYIPLHELGKGGSSRVFRALGANLEVYAVKSVDLRDCKKSEIENFVNEIELLKQLKDNSCVIRYLDSQIFSDYLFIVLECGEVDLSTYITAEASKLSLNRIKVIWQQMLEAVDCVHQNKIVHADLKPANFVFVRGRLKIIDFGIAKKMSAETTKIMREETIGTIDYISPEGIGGDKAIKQGRASDVWSLGCILYLIIYGETPFKQVRGWFNKLHAIKDPDYPIPFNPNKFESQQVCDTLRMCLQRDPTKRAQISYLLNEDPLLQN